MNEQLLKYYNGDDFSAGVWLGKYAVKNRKGEYEETTPVDMHKRMAKELARAERKYYNNNIDKLSEFGKSLANVEFTEEFIFSYFDRFKYISPQGSIMSMLGNKYAVGSLSNCFVVPSPHDSYAGICYTDQHLAQLMKRRGGVGTNINTLRPSGSPVKNAAGTSTGAVSFMHRYSNTTREVAQNGRRGALMLLISCLHPEVFDFVKIKQDRTKVTGANISVMLTDKFMQAVEENEDFICRFPVTDDTNYKVKGFKALEELEYNKLINTSGLNTIFPEACNYIMKIRAKELFDLIVENAWDNAEPGIAFIDRIINYSPEGVYEQFKPTASNPCGEQWMQAFDACRLLALNYFGVVVNPYTKDAYVDWEKLYEIAYIQQRLADDIVDLEIEYVDRIINKIKADPEPENIKAIELELWENIKKTATASRRTGCGFTALGDTLAALGLKYDSEEGIAMIEKLSKKKMEAELDCTIDLAIQRGTFEGWDKSKEFQDFDNYIIPCNEFYAVLLKEFPKHAERMYHYGRRNVSWSTVAPTGTVSIVAILTKWANTTSGIEPMFAAYYFRKKKVNPSDKNVRVDLVDQNGDSWQEYAVMQGGFKEWININYPELEIDNLSPKEVHELYEKSPYYGSCANDISWEKRIQIQGIVQKYTTNAISSTLNLPKDVSKETVANIYMTAHKEGLKGVTIYRDGCRTGVLSTEQVKKVNFDYRDAAKRPKELDADLHTLTVKGIRYGVIVGLFEGKPYEIFAFELPEDVKNGCSGKVIKMKKGVYNFVCDDGSLRNLQIAALRKDEQVLTRLVSGMLRHGAKPQFIMEQIDKSDLEIVSFGKAISRTLKKYVKEEELVSRNTCKDCGSSNVRMQEGCLTCMDCGSSKCG
jgi:ribonucleoside-diphosphate reductase alpha chain